MVKYRLSRTQEKLRKGVRMEGFSTYKNIQDIADRAAVGYKKEVDGDVHKYAQRVVSLYQTDDAPEPIRSNIYYRHLLENYSSTICNEVVKRIRAVK